VLWYFGSAGQPPLKLTLSADAAASSQSVTATVTAWASGSFPPLAGATIYFGAQSAASSGDGSAAISAPDGYYQVYAQKTGYIRSNSILLKIGNPAASAISLSADFNPGSARSGYTPPPSTGTSGDFKVDRFGIVTDKHVDNLKTVAETAERRNGIRDAAPDFCFGTSARMQDVNAQMSENEVFQSFAPFRRKSWRERRMPSSLRARISAARTAAFFTPAEPIATVATGMPAGIWTME